MAPGKYPINKEFFPLNLFIPPISAEFALLAQKNMKIPGFLFRDPDLLVRSGMIPAHDGGRINVIVISPKSIKSPAPCLIDYHGGGFVFPAYASHYHMAMDYARLAGCRVIMPLYRMAPEYPFPYPQEDAYAALLWVRDHADDLGIDPARIAVGGDSAGGALAVTTCLLDRDRGSGVKPLFQLLIYPWLDGRNQSESCRKYTDTPMWNSSLSDSVTPIIDPHPEDVPLMFRSPIEAESFEGMPPAYVEVAEFDCLHDDGVLYTEILSGLGIPAELRETCGTMHGFDTKYSAPTTQRMIAERAAYMKRFFENAL